MTQNLKKLKIYLADISNLQAAAYVLEWDQAVNLNSEHGGHPARAGTWSYLKGLYHEKFISSETEDLLEKAEEDKKNLNPEEVRLVELVRSDLDKSRKLPVEFVRKLSEETSEAYEFWMRAKESSDFSILAPRLERVVALKREEAELIGYEETPYNALLDDYEPGFTTKDFNLFVEQLKPFLIDATGKLAEASAGVDTRFLYAEVKIERQRQFIKFIAPLLGFSESFGRIDESPHPFCASSHPSDIRVTVRRYSEGYFINDRIYSLIHEIGHGMHFHNLSVENYGNPLGECDSYGISESQSRFPENIIGRSWPFCKFFIPLLKEQIPDVFGCFPTEDIYKALNVVGPSLIRVDADEVSYNLHIIFHTELEIDLIEGTLRVKDLPEAWNSKVKQYLGLDVPDDAHGVLQDGHWTDGDFGYKPTYMNGNIYSAQFYWTALKSIPDFWLHVERGEFGIIFDWFKEKVHMHGRLYDPAELVQRVTGSSPSPEYLIKYFKDKFESIYNVKL